MRQISTNSPLWRQVLRAPYWPGAGVTAVLAHVTSVGPSANSYMTTWAPGDAQPTAAHKNYGPDSGGPFGHTAITNDLIVIPLDGTGRTNLYNLICN